jgi:hypothetical protein
MRVKTALPAVLGALMLVLPGSALGQAPNEDSVVVTGDTTDRGGLRYLDIDLDAVSGPSGEAPTGHGFFVLWVTGSTLNIGSLTTDNVTCVAVDGNSAVVRFLGPFGSVIVKAADNGPAGSGLDQFWAINGGNPADCSWPANQPLQPLVGDVVIHDAPPLPTSKDQCKGGGWKRFGVFKNQGDCVSYVATKGKNQPGT